MSRGFKLPAVRLRILREGLNLTQQDIADKIGCDLRTYRKWESLNGDSQPSAYFLVKLADIYDVSADFLLCRTDLPSIKTFEISELTGLTQGAVAALRNIIRDPDIFRLWCRQSALHQNTASFLSEILVDIWLFYENAYSEEGVVFDGMNDIPPLDSSEQSEYPF